MGCAHVMTVLWYLGFARWRESQKNFRVFRIFKDLSDQVRPPESNGVGFKSIACVIAGIMTFKS